MTDFDDKPYQQMIAELTSGDDSRAEAAARRLSACGDEVVGVLQELCNHPDADKRWWSLRALSEIPCETSKAVLIEALCDGDSGVRYCAALGLRQQPTALAISSLVGQLDSPDKLLARLACDALIQIGEAAVPTLLAVLENGTQEVRLEAMRALAHIGDKRSIPQLFKTLDEGSALLEYWADKGLQKMGIGMMFYKP